MFENIRRLRRSLRVARTAARIYLGYKRTQRRVRGKTDEEAAIEWERRHEQSAEALYRLAVELKGLYIKMGQFIGTRADVAPEPFIRSLSRLQDKVPPRPPSQVRATIEQQFGRPIRELFAWFDDTPLAAASLAQVHRATLHDGRNVVVKVQYPEVASLVRLDLRNLRTLVSLVAWREPNFDYRAIVNEMASQFPHELDFVREAEMTRRVAANLREMDGVGVSRVVDEMVRPKAFVTEYVDGTRLLDRHRIAGMGIDPGALARTITTAYGHQIMIDGLFQADPHPGNILVLPDGVVVLLDFGLTKELPKSMRLAFAKLVVAAGDRDPSGILSAFRELGVRTKTDDPNQLVSLMSLFFEARPAGEDRQVAVAESNAALSRNPIEAIPGDLVLLGRVVALLRGVCSSLGAPLSPMQMLRPYAERALAEDVSHAGSHGERVGANG